MKPKISIHKSAPLKSKRMSIKSAQLVVFKLNLDKFKRSESNNLDEIKEDPKKKDSPRLDINIFIKDFALIYRDLIKKLKRVN